MEKADPHGTDLACHGSGLGARGPVARSHAALAAGNGVIAADRRIKGTTELASAYPGRAEAGELDVTDSARIDACLNAAAQQTQEEREAWESLSRGTDFDEK